MLFCSKRKFWIYRKIWCVCKNVYQTLFLLPYKLFRLTEINQMFQLFKKMMLFILWMSSDNWNNIKNVSNQGEKTK